MEDILNGADGLNVLQLVVVVCAGIPELAQIPHRKAKEKRANNKTSGLLRSRRSATLRHAVSFSDTGK